MPEWFVLMVTTLSGGFFVWFLNEISKISERRQQRKAVLGETLLILFHTWKILMRIEHRIETDFDQPLLVRSIMERVSPLKVEDIPERYKIVLEKMAQIDPILAYELQSHEHMLLWANELRNIMVEAQKTDKDFSPDSNTTRHIPVMKKALKESIEKVALRHGVITWLRSKKILERKEKQVEERIKRKAAEREPSAKASD